MHHHPVQLIRKLRPVIQGILPHGINADKQISVEKILLTIIKCYNVSKVIVLEILHIYIKYIIVGAEYNTNIAQLLHFAASNGLKPTIIQQLMLENKINILIIISYDSNYPKQWQIYNIKMKIIGFATNYLYL